MSDHYLDTITFSPFLRPLKVGKIDLFALGMLLVTFVFLRGTTPAKGQHSHHGLIYTIFKWHAFSTTWTITSNYIARNHSWGPEHWTCQINVRNYMNNSPYERLKDSDHTRFRDEHCFPCTCIQHIYNVIYLLPGTHLHGRAMEN